MLKMIITCRRNPAMSRPEFFDHLRNVHWPLIQQYPDVLAAVPGYVQNHSVLPEPGFELSAPYRIAAERDSVIELKFEGVAAILPHINNTCVRMRRGSTIYLITSWC